METVYYIFMGLLILFGVFGIINMIFKISKDNKNELLDKMLENKDINSENEI